tara:strand:- start:1466 stop:2014 length:549 start_codon:yes stop_codon:yes gene_type:complete
MRSGKVRRKSVKRKVRGKTLGRKRSVRKTLGRKRSGRKTLGRKRSGRKRSGRKRSGRKNRKRMRGGDNPLTAEIVKVTVISRAEGAQQFFQIRPETTKMRDFIERLNELAKVDLGQVYLDNNHTVIAASLMPAASHDKTYKKWINSLSPEEKQKFNSEFIEKDDSAHPPNVSSASTLTFYTK